MKIKCSACQAETTLSLLEPNYEGPFRCWKCHALFTIQIKDKKLKSCRPLSQEEFERQQKVKAIQDKPKRQFPGR